MNCIMSSRKPIFNVSLSPSLFNPIDKDQEKQIKNVLQSVLQRPVSITSSSPRPSKILQVRFSIFNEDENIKVRSLGASSFGHIHNLTFDKVHIENVPGKYPTEFRAFIHFGTTCRPSSSTWTQSSNILVRRAPSTIHQSSTTDDDDHMDEEDGDSDRDDITTESENLPREYHRNDGSRNLEKDRCKFCCMFFVACMGAALILLVPLTIVHSLIPPDDYSSPFH